MTDHTPTPEAKIRRHLTGLIGAVDNGNVALTDAVDEILATYVIFNIAAPAVSVITTVDSQRGVERFLGATGVSLGDRGELYVNGGDGKLAAVYAERRWDAAIDSTYVMADEKTGDA